MKMKVEVKLILGIAGAIGIGCDASGDSPPDVPSTIVDAFDVPLDGLTAADVERFNDGDALFGLPFRPVDGLGPLFIRTSCASCHAEAGRGPGWSRRSWSSRRMA